jgi:hypothetical protein
MRRADCSAVCRSIAAANFYLTSFSQNRPLILKGTMMSGAINWSNAPTAHQAAHFPSAPNAATAFSTSLNAASLNPQVPSALPRPNDSPLGVVLNGANWGMLMTSHRNTVLMQNRDPNFSPCEDMTGRETRQHYHQLVLQTCFQTAPGGSIERCGSYAIRRINGTPRIVRKKDGRE